MEIEIMSAAILEVTTGLPGYYTLTEAAKELGYLSTGNMATECREGKITAYKVGKTWLIPQEVVLYKKQQEISFRGNRGQARK